MRVAHFVLIGALTLGACAESAMDAGDSIDNDVADVTAGENETSAEAELRRRRKASRGDAAVSSDTTDAGSSAAVDAGSVSASPVDAGQTKADAGTVVLPTPVAPTVTTPVTKPVAPPVTAPVTAPVTTPVTTPTTPTAGGVWRPFTDASPWNTPIAQNPKLASDSQSLISDLRTSSPFGEHLDINMAGYSIPLYYANASTPTVDVTCDIGGAGFTGSNGMNAHANVPMPAGAAPDPQGDHHLAIIDRTRNIEWGLWGAQNSSGKWTCGLGATADLAGDGLRPYKPTNPTWYTSHGARACGFPLIAGLIRTEEIEAGHIDHALVIAYPHIRAGFYMSPASTAQARSGNDSISTRGIPCGGRVQLDPALDLNTLGLSRAGRIVAEAMQKYGAYVGDYSGAISLYAENEPSAQSYWSNVLDIYEFRDKLDMSKLRVLEFGALTDDGNGG
jgi:hypothetical protein